MAKANPGRKPDEDEDEALAKSAPEDEGDWMADEDEDPMEDDALDSDEEESEY